MKYFLFVAVFMSSTFWSATVAQNSDETGKPIIKHAPGRSFPRSDSSDFSVGEVRGSVQNIALYLPKPIYPDDARRLGLEGIVRVQIRISEQGFVVDALMLSGDPLLKTCAEEAASKSKFKPLLDKSGRAIATEGVLSYSFKIKTIGWSRIGADLLTLEGPSASIVPVPVIIKSLDPEWTGEIATLKRLGEISATAAPRFVPMRTMVTTGKNQQSQSNRSSSSVSGTLTLPASPLEQQTLVQDLISSIRGRLADDERSLWHFNLGLDLTRAFYLSTMIETPRTKNPNRFTEASVIISSRIGNMPNGVSDEVVTALRKLEKNLAIEKRTKAEDDEISASIMTILNQND